MKIKEIRALALLFQTILLAISLTTGDSQTIPMMMLLVIIALLGMVKDGGVNE